MPTKKPPPSTLGRNAIVDEHMSRLAHPLADVADALRSAILRADARLAEGVKWNAPSYALDGADRITLNLHAKDKVRVVFHCGTKPAAAKPKAGQAAGRLVDDPAGLLEWPAPDRAIASFATVADVRNHEPALADLVHRWLEAATED